MYQLGELQILRAVESEVPIFDTYTFFPDATKDVIEANRDWLMPRYICLLYTSPSPRDATLSRMPSSA